MAVNADREWNLVELGEVESTNDLCRGLAPWSAVRAERQTRGRGRFGRKFVSGEGGLWISAVLPAGGPSGAWSGFSLRVGLELRRFLLGLGVAGTRLRWPNDLMVGARKIGGLLIEQPASGVLIVGFGMNVRNEPWDDDTELRGVATRLADWVEAPALGELAHGVLRALAEAHWKMVQGGLAVVVQEWNAAWGEPVPVEVALSGGAKKTGLFRGLGMDGNLELIGADGGVFFVDHSLVERLAELA